MSCLLLIVGRTGPGQRGKRIMEAATQFLRDEWLDRAVELRDPWIIPIRTHPIFDPLRSDMFHCLRACFSLRAPRR
jgi:hypothetical protein